MEKKIRKILNSFLDKYEVPKEAIDGIIQKLVEMMNNPLTHRTGATVMTENASMAGDKGSDIKAKPEVL